MLDQRDFLEPLEGNIKHRKFAVLDLESKDGASPTEPGFTRVFMAGFYDGESYECFKGPNCLVDLMAHILQPRYRGWHIYAHNGGRFDFLHLLPLLVNELEEQGYTFSIIPAGRSGAIQILDIKKGKNRRAKSWRFLDSMRLIPISLAKAAATFQLPGKTDLPMTTHEDHADWRVYNEQDCIALWSVISRFTTLVQEQIGGEIGVTAPATAMKTFRRRYLKQLIHRGASTHDFIYPAYCGGRCEDFIKSISGLHYYDFNSSYPAAMLEPMPVGEPIEWNGPPPKQLTDSGKYVGFVECDVDLDPNELPPLPVKREGKLLFPAGRITGTWDWCELSIVRDRVHRWGRSVWYECKPVFREMVQDLYPLRLKSHPNYSEGLSYVVKLLLNSLYGKFGQKPDRRQVVRRSADMPAGAVPADGTPESLIWYIHEMVDSPYIIPQIAAHITALARVRLYHYMRQCPPETLAYCDTDSIFTTHVFESGDRLGELKDEYPGVTFQGEFLGPKMYCLTASRCIEKRCSEPETCIDPKHRSKVAAKGIRERSLVNFETLKSGGTVESRELQKLGILARKGFPKPDMFTMKKSLKNPPKKRLWRGNRSSPVVLEEW